MSTLKTTLFIATAALFAVAGTHAQAGGLDDGTLAAATEAAGELLGLDGNDD